MKKEVNIEEFERVNRNLWKRNSKFYRLFGERVTPNHAWIIAPRMVELVNIDTATGDDVYGSDICDLGLAGTVSACNEFLRS